MGNRQGTQEVNIQELTQQLKIPLYKQLIGNTAMVDLSSLSANPQVCSSAAPLLAECRLVLLGCVMHA